MSDQQARDRIATDLDTNFLVEAGAGSGKTTALVGRLVAHIRRGTPVEALAAVTFTRKAANELRERFQNALEEGARELTGVEQERVREALEDLDRGFIGTIHAFCARLLRERAIEAGLDPTFQELDEEGWPELVQAFYRGWLDELRLANDPAPGALEALGLEAGLLSESFARVVEYPDVTFRTEGVAAPGFAECRAVLEELLDQAARLMPAEEPEAGWDDLQSRVRHLRFLRDITDWGEARHFFRALGLLVNGKRGITQNRWSDTKAGKEQAKALAQAFEEYVAVAATPALTRWLEYRYAPVLAFLQRAARDFERRRAVTGQLGFQDLLTRAAQLLRENPAARAALGARYQYLLVDEFQDTDPLQAEVCFLLASDPSEGRDWRTVAPRPGALFVVGDPKQSIYRFRRADISIYETVKRLIARRGEVLRLTRNFRSTTEIGEFVNTHFATVFPGEASEAQAAFSPLECQKEGSADEGVRRLVTVAPKYKDQILGADAARIAAWIEARTRADATDRQRPGAFMVITYHTAGIDAIARALAARNIPARTAGARLPQEAELRELVLLLQVLADPENAVRVAAVLEGIFFGLTPADLYEARRAGTPFAITRLPEGDGPVAEALGTLHRWWLLAREVAPDVLLDRLADETGLLAWSASQDLGDGRAGAILRLADILRRHAGPEVFDLPSAITRLEAVLGRAGDDAPLRAGLDDAVQVLNLHKAKGLEAEVVILATPWTPPRFEPELHVRRAEDGSAL